MDYEFSKEKNEILKQTWNISFEEIIGILGTHLLLDIIPNPSVQHPTKKIYIVYIQDYVFCVPFIDKGQIIELRTIYPSRKFFKKYEYQWSTYNVR